MTFIGAVIVAIAFLIAIMLAISWIINSQKFYFTKPDIVVESATKDNNTIYLTIKNYGRESATLENIYIYEPRKGKYYIATPGTHVITDPTTGTDVGNFYITKTSVAPGGVLKATLEFTIVELDEVLKGIATFDKALASFEIVNYTAIMAREVEPGTLWKGVYLPEGGFKLIGYDQLMAKGNITAWTPPIRVFLGDGWRTPSYVNHDVSFIYDDPEHPGLYMLKITFSGSGYLWYRDLLNGGSWNYLYVKGKTVCIKGFVGTYSTTSATYLSGYAFEIDYGSSCSNVVISDDEKRYITSLSPYNSITSTTNILSEGIDYDGNRVKELVMFSYLNGPLVTEVNTDAESYYDEYHDALVWEYVVAHDISNADYIKVSGKINYYWTLYYSINEPAGFRILRIFAIVVYKLVNGEWKIEHYKSYSFTWEKPKQYVFNAVFPVNRSEIYRVGILFYDNYMDFDADGSYYLDFTYTLEHLVVEIGVSNPIVPNPPPIFVLAIPGEEVDSIGEDAIGASNALSNFTYYMKGEIGYVGIPGYVVVDSCDKFTALIMNPEPGREPKNAIVFDLHGNASNVCGYNFKDILEATTKYNLIWVRTAGALFNSTLDPGGVIQNTTPTWLNITDYGKYVKRTYGPVTFYDSLLFNNSLEVSGSFTLDVGDTTYTFTMLNATYNGTVDGSEPREGSVILEVEDPNGNIGYIVYNGVAITPSGVLTKGVGYYTATQLAVYPAIDLWIQKFGTQP